MRYNRGDSTILTETASQVARELQTVAMEEDAREGLVDNYLSILLPADWDKRSAEKRLMYYQNINGVMQEKGTVQRDPSLLLGNLGGVPRKTPQRYPEKRLRRIDYDTHKIGMAPCKQQNG